MKILLGRVVGNIKKNRIWLGRKGSIEKLVDNKLVERGWDEKDMVGNEESKGRDEKEEDEVLIEKMKSVNIKGKRRLGKKKGSLMERRGRDERRSMKRRIGDKEEERIEGERIIELLDKKLVDILKIDEVKVVKRNIEGIEGLSDLKIMKNMEKDKLDVIVVDKKEMKEIELMDLVKEVGRKRLKEIDRKNVMRWRVEVEDIIKILDEVKVMKMERIEIRNEIIKRIDSIVVRIDNDEEIVIVVEKEKEGKIDIGDDGVVIRKERLKKLRKERKKKGDVIGIGDLNRKKGDKVERIKMRERIKRKDRLKGEKEEGIEKIRKFKDIEGIVIDENGRIEIRKERGRKKVDEKEIGDKSRIVGSLRKRKKIEEILKIKVELKLSNDRKGIRIKIGNEMEEIESIEIVKEKKRKIGKEMERKLIESRVEDKERNVKENKKEVEIGVEKKIEVEKIEGELIRRLKIGDVEKMWGKEKVEGKNGEMGERIEDRMRGDKEERLKMVERSEEWKVEEIEIGEKEVEGLKGEGRKDENRMDERIIDDIEVIIIDNEERIEDELEG